jgi:leucyl aminopeptidase
MNGSIIILKSKKELETVKKHLTQIEFLELSSLIKSGFKFNPKQVYNIFNSNLAKSKKQLLITILPKFNQKKLRLLASSISQESNTNKIKELNIITSDSFTEQDIVEIKYAYELADYKFTKFLKKENKPTKLTFKNNLIAAELKQKLKEVSTLTEAINYVRDLVNTPSLDLTPLELANQAKKLCKSHSSLKLTELKEKELIKNKLNLIHSVGLGSGQESRLLFIQYSNGPKTKKPILLVGKGVTFDAGGLNLKPTNSIESMKIDMAGAATVLGVMKMVAELKLEINIVAAIPTVENLLGHNAYKPGDILTAYNKKTVEITNTDAEGRLILADAISYGIDKYAPSMIIDIATLTGACIAALGHNRTAVISNNKALVNKFWKASKISGDLIWPLPLDNYHRSKVKGTISDYKNWTAGVQAGAIMGGAFIEKFIQKKPWVHLDIAGSSYYETNIDHLSKGATGRPVNLVYEFLKKESGKK